MSDFDFQPYLSAIVLHYAKDDRFYTLTDALLPLEVRSVERQEKEGQEKKVEQFRVLAGLRKYALGDGQEHVLLAGRPGSGKSTALRQLVVALAADGLVPVLVQLKGDRTVPELIKAEFRRAKVRVTDEQIEDWLLADRLVLLLDGVNEIPNEELRRSLAQFREENLTVPMIFTTRDLSLGGDLGIGKRLEMKPLSPEQLKEFVGKRLGEKGEQLLGQLRDRLREIAETPLLLKMLCDVFEQTGEVPQNKGELFRRFDGEYERFKGLPAVSADFRRFKSEILQRLAFVMMQGDGRTEFWLTIERTQAERAIEQWLTNRVSDPAGKAKEWLEDLLEHHLLQVAAEVGKVEFHHQLFQEYYAAEALLGMFRDRDPAVCDRERFQEDYLNYLKWTEVVAIGLSLMEDEKTAVALVKQALDVDLMLGAQLAGAVKRESHPQALMLVNALGVPDWLKTELLGETLSNYAIPGLLTLLEDNDSEVCERTIKALGTIGSETAIPGLLRLVEHSSPYVRKSLAEALGAIGSETAIPGLLRLVEDSDPDDFDIDDEYWRNTLGSPDVRESAAEALGVIASQAAIPDLLKLVEYFDSDIRSNAAKALRAISPEIAISGLLKLIENTPPYVRRRVAKTLGEIGSEAAIPGLFKLAEDSVPYVRRVVVYALGEISSEATIPVLLKLLDDPDIEVSERTAYVLDKINSKAVVPGLLKLTEDSEVREESKKALSKTGSETAIADHLKLAEDSEFEVSKKSGEASRKVSSEIAIADYLKLVEDSDSRVRESAAHMLGRIRSESTIPTLLKLVEDSDLRVRETVADALGELGSESTIPALLKLMEDSDGRVLCLAAEALSNLSKKHPDKIAPHLPHILNLIPTDSGEYAHRVILAIQASCKFYNYEIFHSPPAKPQLTRQFPPATTINQFPNATEVKIIEHIDNYHASSPRDPPS
jgi:HEAT repeat protein/energy-coupling factor transporter ATP-binding protein EcfA2